MNATRKVKLKDINSNLTCKLCSGYLVDATTIIECLHSFCKSCIINYLEKNDRDEKYCPVCDVQLHSTRPLTSIRSDLMLQEIVYKLVPGLFKNEMLKRREFYKTDGTVPTNPLDSGNVFDELYITSDDVMHLSMEYETEDEKLRESTKRYLKCPAAVSIFVLKKLLQGKYDLDANTNIDIMFGDRMLPDDFLLMDVAYKYSWTKNGNKPLTLRYRIKAQGQPTIKLDKTIDESVSGPVKTEELNTPAVNKKKVCNENGSNIMPSEDVKPSQNKRPRNGLITPPISIAPIKTPNGKIKGRKRKALNYSDIVIESKDDIKNFAKRLKLDKATVKTTVKKSQSDNSFNAQTQVDKIPASNKNDSAIRLNHIKDVKEVQLQISENGVMSACSVSDNGDNKVVYDLSKRVPKSSSATAQTTNASLTTTPNMSITDKLLFSGNCHSKTGPSGVTEIICDKPDPSTRPLKPTSAKPGYVTLNIPTPKIPISSQSTRIQNSVASTGSITDKKKDNISQNGSLSSSPRMMEKGSANKLDVLEKIKHRITSKGLDGDAVTELGKLGNLGTTIECVNGQGASGMHSLPIIAPLTNPFQQRNKSCNGTGKGSIATETCALPFALNFSPASGMSVSMIPCTSSGMVANGSNFSTSSSTTPSKRSAHTTSVVNGDLKFKTSPKLILPKPNGDHQSSPKKPPKFFKSRGNSPGTSPSSAISSHQYLSASSMNGSSNESKRKTPTPTINGSSTNGSMEPLLKKIKKERKDQAQETANAMKLLGSGVLSARGAQQNTSTGGSNLPPSNDISNSIHVSRPVTFTSQLNDSYSQHLTALKNLAGGNPTEILTSTLGIAASAAATSMASNCLPIGMTPFVTDNYCSLPYLNQRALVGQIPYIYNNSTGYSFLGSTTNLTTATTTPVNSSKSKSTNCISSTGNGVSNGLLPEATLNPDTNVDSDSTLDLSITKPVSSDKGESNPMLLSLLNSRTKSPTGSVINTTTSPSNRKNSGESREKSSSPLIRHLLEQNDGNGKARSVSPNAKTKAGINGKGNNDEVKNTSSENCNNTGVGNGKTFTSLKNRDHEKSQNGSPSKPNAITDNTTTSNGTEPNLAVPSVSPKLKADNDSNTICSGSGIDNSTKFSLEKEKLLSLSAQNNNIHTVSNSHNNSNTNGNLGSVNGTNNNEKSDNVSSAGTQLSS